MTPQVAVVTGGASGIGRLVAHRLAAGGAQVAVLDWDDERLRSHWTDRPGVLPVVCDVTDPGSVRAAVDRVTAELGAVDRLVHCAGIMPGGLIEESSPEDILRVHRVNVDGTVHITTAILPGMRARGQGEIVVLGSITGYVYSRRFGAYCSSKAAVNAYTEILAEEQRGTGVHVMLVCPPAVATPLLQQAVDGGPEPVRRAATGRGRSMSPEAVADAIDRGLARRRTVVIPGEAKAFYALRRLSPRVTWALTRRFG